MVVDFLQICGRAYHGEAARCIALAASSPTSQGHGSAGSSNKRLPGFEEGTHNFGTFAASSAYQASTIWRRRNMDGLIYLVGLIVIVMAILSFFGLR